MALGATAALAGCHQQPIEETPVPEETEQASVEELEAEDKKVEPAERVDGKPFSSASKLEEISASFRASSTKKMPWDNLALWDDRFSFEQL